MLEYIFYIVGTLFILMYGAMPLLVLVQNKLPERYEMLEVAEDKFYLDSDDAFKALFSDIKRNNFHYAASASFEQQATHTRFSIFVHEEKKLTAILTQITNPNVNTVRYLEISQLYSDHSMIDVVNAPMSAPYPKSARKVTFRFPEVTNVASLVAITERIIRKHLSSKVAITLQKGKEVKTIEEFSNDEMAELITKGWVQNSVQNGARSLTLKGTYLMTWKMLWPLKQVREYRDLAFSKKILG